MRRAVFRVILVAAVAGATCGHAAPSRSGNGDPWERFNRRAFAINQALDRVLIRPLALLAHGLTPGPIGMALHNVISTLREPVVVVNDLLQMRPRKAAASVARLAINLTVGLLGTIDMATRVGVPYHPNGFGDTLGRYGVGPGPYVFLPLLGPSDVRDLFGASVDVVSTPLFYIAYPYKTDSNVTVAVVGGLATRGEADSDLEALMSDAADPYATLRSTYLQSRQGEIDDKQVLPALPDMGDPAPPPATTPSPSAANDLAGVPGPNAGVRLDRAQAFEALPDQEGRDADGQVAAALEQGQGQGKVGTEAEEGAEQGVGALLDADAHGGDEGGAAHRADQALDGQD